MNTLKIATSNVDSLRVRAGMVGARSPGYFVFSGNQDEYCWLDYESAHPLLVPRVQAMLGGRKK